MAFWDNWHLLVLICHFQEFRPESMLLGEPLDSAEKRRSKGTVSRCSAWVPVTHASVAPVPRHFFRLAPSRRSHGSLPQQVSWP
jgi:hypothetical protein